MSEIILAHGHNRVSKRGSFVAGNRDGNGAEGSQRSPGLKERCVVEGAPIGAAKDRISRKKVKEVRAWVQKSKIHEGFSPAGGASHSVEARAARAKEDTLR